MCEGERKIVYGECVCVCVRREVSVLCVSMCVGGRDE